MRIFMKHFFLLFAAAFAYAGVVAQTWVRVNEVPNQTVWSVVQQNNTLYVGLTGKVYIGANNGSTWTPSADVGHSPIFSLTTFKNKLYAGTWADGVFQSSDNGAHWQAAGSALLGISKLEVWNNSLYAATAGDGIFKFNDATNQWTSFNNDLPTNVDGVVYDIISTGATLVAAAGLNSFFYKFDTVRKSWNTSQYFPFTRPGYLVEDLMLDSATLYAGTQDFLLRSNDTGNTWAFDRSGMHPGNLVMTHGAEKDYVVSNFLNLNTGKNTSIAYERARGAVINTPWTQTDSIVNTYFYNVGFANGRLYSARDTGLYYKQVETVTAVPNVITHVQQVRLFPNPSNGRTNIHFELTQRKKISVQVLDITGKLIAEPYHDLNLNTGLQDLSVDLSRLQSAIYLIRMVSENEQLVKRVVVSR